MNLTSGQNELDKRAEALYDKAKHNFEFFDKFHVIQDYKNYIQKGWDDERIEKWFKTYIPLTYNVFMLEPLVTYEYDTPFNWRVLYRLNGYKELHGEVSKAYNKYPNDIDKAYEYMCELESEYIESIKNRCKQK